MTDDEWSEFIETVKANDRSHAGYFSWRSDRDIEELGVVQAFHESLTHAGVFLFEPPSLRGRGNDPPDCEAVGPNGSRIGIEVTELVDDKALVGTHDSAWLEPYSRAELFDLLRQRIAKKDNPKDVRGGPYDAYYLVIYCDEPRVLDHGLIKFIGEAVFPATSLIERAFMLLSYCPTIERCPYIELRLNGS